MRSHDKKRIAKLSMEHTPPSILITPRFRDLAEPEKSQYEYQEKIRFNFHPDGL